MGGGGDSSGSSVRGGSDWNGGGGVVVSDSEPRPTIRVMAKQKPKVHKKKVIKRATFAGGFFVAPNPIDFSKAFAGFANLAENPVAFATVLSIFGIYLLLLFWARREDRKDVERVSQFFLFGAKILREGTVNTTVATTFFLQLVILLIDLTWSRSNKTRFSLCYVLVTLSVEFADAQFFLQFSLKGC